MGAAVVVEADPVADGACRVLYAVEALAVDALFFQCPDHTLDHAVLLRAMRRDELLSYSPIFGQISGLFKLLPAPADRFRWC